MGEAFDQTKVKKASFLELLKRIGPGIILAGVVIGPGISPHLRCWDPTMDTQ